MTVSTADSSAAVTPARAAFSAYSAGGGPGFVMPCEMPSITHLDAGRRRHEPEDRGDALERQRIHGGGLARDRAERLRQRGL